MCTDFKGVLYGKMGGWGGVLPCQGVGSDVWEAEMRVRKRVLPMNGQKRVFFSFLETLKKGFETKHGGKSAYLNRKRTRKWWLSGYRKLRLFAYSPTIVPLMSHSCFIQYERIGEL